MKTLLSLCLLVCLTSCSLLTKKGQADSATAQTATPYPISESRARALEATRVATNNDDPNRIIGSAKILHPDQFEGKSFFLYGAEHLNLENYYFDFPVVYNDAVKKWINYFLNRGRDFFERYSARAGRYAPIMGKILEEHGLPRDLIFLAMAESGFQNNAKSWARAVGPWQFMPYTGKRYGLKIDWYVDERRDPLKASISAALYLKKLYGDFGSWELAAAGYNAGEGKISRAIRRYNTENFWDLRQGRYLKAETKNYVPKIMALAIIGKNLKTFGFEDIDFHEPLDFEEIDAPPMTDLYRVAEILEIDFEEVQRLNPEINRWFTPPSAPYKLRVPVGTREIFEEKAKGQNLVASDFMRFKIKGSRSDLADVAKVNRIKDPEVLAVVNPGIAVNQRLQQGQEVFLPFKNGQSLKDNMYADLFEKPRKEVVRRNSYKNRIKLAQRRAAPIKNPSQYYTVKRGDSLWTVAKKTGTSLDQLIVSNMKIIQHRQIRAGDVLAVR
jgi:membrane-bound lytic murein transglycosylase D